VAETARDGRSWLIADTVMLLLFAFSVVVQFNDPDRLRWAAIYAAAALACLLSVARRLPWGLPALIGTAAILWAVSLAPDVVGRVPFLDMFGAFEMKDEGIEVSREMYGLVLVATWMAILTWRAVRRAPGRSHRS
jgi:hypothetical protein